MASGCYNVNGIENSKEYINIPQTSVRQRMAETGHFYDDLYYNRSQFDGILSLCNKSSNNSIQMKSFVKTMIDLLDQKCIVCDAMLILAFEYCQQTAPKSQGPILFFLLFFLE